MNKLHVESRSQSSFLMTSDRGDKGSHRIPIRFEDADDDPRQADSNPSEMEELVAEPEDLFEDE